MVLKDENELPFFPVKLLFVRLPSSRGPLTSVNLTFAEYRRLGSLLELFCSQFNTDYMKDLKIDAGPQNISRQKWKKVTEFGIFLY